MIDIKWIRENAARFDAGLKSRGLEACAEKLIALDEMKRELQTKSQELQSERNTVAKAIGEKKRSGENADNEQARAADIKAMLPELEDKLEAVTLELKGILETLPNTPLESVPQGDDEADNETVKTWGTPREFTFTPKAHWDVGEDLGYMDFETAARMSGARFVMLRGKLAQLERALAAFMVDLHTTKFGYEEVSPPLLVRDQGLYGAGLLPKFAEDAFHTEDGRWLIPTAEVSLSNIVRETILEPEQLPIRFVAHTPCFRAESGSAGRDTRGMIRLHQFNKVELVSITHPDQTHDEHERMTECAEAVLEALELPYRKMLLCTGDMGVQSERTYDLEVWVPSENTYREISSCSRCGDYQARRMDTRVRLAGDQGGKKAKTEYVHTLNGSGLAVGRTLVAVLENYQNEDGSVSVPKVLQPYMNNLDTIK